MSRLISILFVTTVCLLVPHPASAADDPRAIEARRACAAARVDRGIELLVAIYAETGDVNAIYNQARCYQQNARPEHALERFREFLRVAGSDASEHEQVTGFIRELESEIAARDRRASLARAAANASGVAASTSNDRSARGAAGRWPAYLAASVGTAALLGGAYFSWQTRSLHREVERPLPVLTPTGLADLSSRGERAQRWQWIGYGLGSAALVTSAALFWFSGGSETSSRISLDFMVNGDGASARAGGRF